MTLTRLKEKDLVFILNYKNLEDLKIYSCTIEDYSALSELKELKRLFINGVRKNNENFSFLSRLTSIEYLGIGYAPEFKNFPDLSNSKLLKELAIFKCKNLVDISSIAKIPNLERFSIVETPQKPNDLEFIMKHSTIRLMSGAFGGRKVDEEFHELLKKHGLQYG